MPIHRRLINTWEFTEAMMDDAQLAAISGDLNATTQTAARTARLAPLVRASNDIIRKAADERLTIDSSPQGFDVLKGEAGSSHE